MSEKISKHTHKGERDSDVKPIENTVTEESQVKVAASCNMNM
jgi:hypothetical protein